MESIDWIENAVEEFRADELSGQIKLGRAKELANKESLGIHKPEETVEKFVRDLPELYRWFGNHYRVFPWRRRLEPWPILLAEILLQRTHADQVAEMYEDFLMKYPEPVSVYETPKDVVREDVDRLGFGDKRTKTLKSLSSTLVHEYNNYVPQDPMELLEVPRIGPYTARACTCFAYGRPLALVDANVAEVVKHTLGYTPTTQPHKHDELYELLDALVPTHSDNARVFNLALIDLKSEVCDTEDSSTCPLELSCSQRSDSRSII